MRAIIAGSRECPKCRSEDCVIKPRGEILTGGIVNIKSSEIAKSCKFKQLLKRHNRKPND